MPSEHLRSDANSRERIHEWVHRKTVFDRRTDRLTSCLDELIPAEATVLDVGCGNGEISGTLAGRSDRRIVGAETRPRASCQVPLFVFDGLELPVKTDSFDWVMFVDVLHHAVDVRQVVTDACRVARTGLVVKDHYADSAWARRVLSVMDWFGNRHLDVDLQDNYLSRDAWTDVWRENRLEVAEVRESLDLYPAIVKPLFENGLHFIAKLTHEGTRESG